MKLTLGFSPCPNDTFIFDALIHHKIDTEGIEFEVFFEDVETLNQKALKAELDITKLSFYAYTYVHEQYVILDAGSALGFGVGPLLICKNQDLANKLDPELLVGIPGVYTTANFLLGIAYPQLGNKKVLLFSDIESSLLDDKIDIGLIIHENRFTYEGKGLHKIIDLGSYWETLTGCAIPLGGIVINRSLEPKVQHKVNRLIRKSVEYAFANPKSCLDFIKSNAQEMNEEVMYKHIDLYVNDYSINLGMEGRKAINVMFKMAAQKGIIAPLKTDIFLMPLS
ncbi:MAG: 1,4-dihydroxy-6-naphthoate synthase [Pedobacter sp.]|nr:1,4-dihydroxy-6-naphthoate synthase [Pedobacter sp.]